MARAPAGRVLAFPNQTPGLKESYGLTRAQVDIEVWLIDPHHQRWQGAAAINRLWAEIGGFWGALSQLYRLPLFRWIEDRVYRWIAEHRGLLSQFYSTTPACEEPGANCE